MAVAVRSGDSPASPAPPSEHLAASAVGGAARNRRRVAALDAFRGLMIAGMIVVNDQGSGGHVIPGFTHASWSGMTAADLVFPGFLVAMGVALGLAARPPAWSRVLRRVALLFALGFVLNLVPRFDLGDVHVMGVLQRIALCYLLASVAQRSFRQPRRLAVACGVALVGYWALFAAGWPAHLGAAAAPHNGGLVGVVDRAVLGARHVYANGPFDPEGLLSTIPATVSVLLGVLAAPLVRGAASARSARRLFAAGAALAAAGAAWATVFPVNKRLWTSSYTLLTGGIAVAMLGVFVYAVARRPFTRGPRRSLTAAGANALVVYIAAEASASVLADVHVGPSSLRTWLWAHALSPWAGAMLGSFLYALVVLAACLALAAVLDRRRLYVRL